MPNKATTQETTKTHSLVVEEEDAEAKSEEDNAEAKTVGEKGTAMQDHSALTLTSRTTMTTRGSRRKDLQVTKPDKIVRNADEQAYIQDRDKYLHDFGSKKKIQARR